MSGAFAYACLAPLAQAQQQDPPPSQNTDPNAAQKPDSAAPTPPVTPGDTQDLNSGPPPIRSMNGAGPLPSGRVSAIQFGPIYLQSADFYQSLSAISAMGQPDLFESFSMFRTQIVFDKTFRESHLAVQYQPRISVIDGHFQTDTADLNAAWNTRFQLSPVLTMAFNDGFSYYSQQGQFDNLDLLSDITTGSLVQSKFLDGNGHFLNNRTELAVNYLISPRSRINVTPFFEYYSSTGSEAINQSESPGISADFSYALSATRSMGLQYRVEDTHFSNLLPTTLYQTFGVTYAQRLSDTLHLAASVGATTSSNEVTLGSGPAARTTAVAATGTFNLIKNFKDSSLAFEYYRGQAVGLQITNGFADRYDVAYNRRISPRLNFQLGTGYYREFQSITDTSGFYGSTGLTYRLADHWSLNGIYSYKRQENGGPALISGNLQYVSFGIRWEPARGTDSY